MPTVSTDSASPGTSSATLFGSWYSFTFLPGLPANLWFDYGPGSLTNNTAFVSTGMNTDGSWNQGISTTADTNYVYKARTDYTGATQGTTESFKTNAGAASFGAPSSSSVTQTTATCSVSFNPNVVESTADLTLYYKKSADPTYSSVNVASGTQANQTYNKGLTGLTAGTTYDYYFGYTRTTNNGTSGSSAGAQFTTRAAQTAASSAATVVTATTAQLNGVVNAVDAANSITYYFQWGLTTGYGNVTANQGPTSSVSDVVYSATLSGLTANTTYHYRAYTTSSESYVVYGSDQSFTTGSADRILFVL